MMSFKAWLILESVYEEPPPPPSASPKPDFILRLHILSMQSTISVQDFIAHQTHCVIFINIINFVSLAISCSY